MHEEKPSVSTETVDLHDIDTLKKIWYMLKNAQTQEEVFTLVRLLLDNLPYDWIDREQNWLLIAKQIEDFGESELASLFKLANQRCFQLSLSSASRFRG